MGSGSNSCRPKCEAEHVEFSSRQSVQRERAPWCLSRTANAAKACRLSTAVCLTLAAEAAVNASCCRRTPSIFSKQLGGEDCVVGPFLAKLYCHARDRNLRAVQFDSAYVKHWTELASSPYLLFKLYLINFKEWGEFVLVKIGHKMWKEHNNLLLNFVGKEIILVFFGGEIGVTTQSRLKLTEMTVTLWMNEEEWACLYTKTNTRTCLDASEVGQSVLSWSL